MAVLYVDFEAGSDAADGTSFSNRVKTITGGVTAARTAPGDTIRIMGSPAPTSLGINGTWTSASLAATKNIVSSTNATPIVVTLTAHGYANGDTLVLTGHTTNTKANGTWEIANVATNTFELVGSTGNGVGGATGTARLRNNTRVKLASALTATIASTGNQGEGRTAWTAAGSVTAILSTGFVKDGDVGDLIDVAAGFTTGIAAYKATGTLNLSGYQQFSFWIYQTAGTLGAAASMSLKLCSDTAGATPVDTFDIPAIGRLFQPTVFTINKGSALGSSIQSIALYINTDNGAQTFYISNIIACKAVGSADSLTLNSMIGKNSGNEPWCGIQSINGTRVMLDGDTTLSPISTTLRGYYGTTETVTTYKRECIPILPMPTSVSDIWATVQEAGTSGSPITYSFGWDRTDMSTRTLETFLDARNGMGQSFVNSLAYVNVDRLYTVRAGLGLQCITGSAAVGGCVWTNIGSFNGGSNSALTLSGIGNSYSNVVSWFNGGNGVALANSSNTYSSVISSCNTSVGLNLSSAHGHTIETVTADNNGSHGVALGASVNNRVKTSVTRGNAGDGVNFATSHNNRIETLTSSGNGTYGIGFSSACNNVIVTPTTSGNTANGIVTNGVGDNYISGASIAESTEVTITQSGAANALFSHDHESVGVHKIFRAGSLCASESSVRHTASGIAWSITPTSLHLAYSPVPLSLAKIACAANLQVTVKAWVRRTNTGLVVRLVCKGAQIAGVANDVTASMTAAADTWEELTITFTPTVAGVVEVIADAQGGTTYTAYVDDLSIAQA